MEVRFYTCETCGNMIYMIKDSGVTPVCCGNEMREVKPSQEEMLTEKHLPVFKVYGRDVYVEVGSIHHPMVQDHYIEWVLLQTQKGMQLARLLPGETPKLCFSLCKGDKLEAVYAFCNIHGLWKTDATKAKCCKCN